MSECLQLVLFLTSVFIFGTILIQAIDDSEESLEDVDLEPGVPVLLADGLIVTQVRGVERCVRRAADGDALTIEYEGRYDGEQGEVFDQTRTKEFPFRFNLGGGGERGGRVIEGLARGVRGMCRGEVRNIFMPHHLA